MLACCKRGKEVVIAIDLGLFTLHVKLAPSEAFAVSKDPAVLGEAASPEVTSDRTLRTQNDSGCGRARL